MILTGTILLGNSNINSIDLDIKRERLGRSLLRVYEIICGRQNHRHGFLHHGCRH